MQPFIVAYGHLYNFYTESQIKAIAASVSGSNLATVNVNSFSKLKNGNTYHCAIIVWNEYSFSEFSWSSAAINGTPNGYVSGTYTAKLSRKVTIYGVGINMPTDTITSYSAQDFLNTQATNN